MLNVNKPVFFFYRFNTMYGITGVPSLVLFHNGKPIAKYNGSDYTLYEFTKFVIRHTGMYYVQLFQNYNVTVPQM